MLEVAPVHELAPDGWLSAAHIERAAELGFGAISEAEYYECRLGAEQRQVDYLVAAPRSRASAMLLQLRALSEREAAGARWAPLLELFASWASGRTSLSHHVPTLWLEFDDVNTDALALPSVSVCLVPAYRTDRPLDQANAHRGLGSIRDTLDILAPARRAELDSLLVRCFDVLPAGARWIHLSVMLGRSPQAVKLYGSVPRRHLVPLLRDLEFQGDLAAIAQLLEREYAADLAGDELFVDLNLDTYHDRRSCTLGLALGQQHVAHGPDRDPARAEALARWEAAGCCVPQRARLAQAWLAGPTCFLDLKLVWRADAPLLAKAYLGSHVPAASTSARASRTSGGS